MDTARAFRSVALIALALCPAGNHGLAAQVSPQAKLWVAVSTPHPVYHQAETETIQLFFAVVNDGTTTVDPLVGSSHLFINGVEAKGWEFIINNGPRSLGFNALPPGQVLSFTYQLGLRYFANPGIYTVRWEVQNFKSPEITLRVMPTAR